MLNFNKLLFKKELLLMLLILIFCETFAINLKEKKEITFGVFYASKLYKYKRQPNSLLTNNYSQQAGFTFCNNLFIKKFALQLDILLLSHAFTENYYYSGYNLFDVNESKFNFKKLGISCSFIHKIFNVRKTYSFFSLGVAYNFVINNKRKNRLFNNSYTYQSNFPLTINSDLYYLLGFQIYKKINNISIGLKSIYENEIIESKKSTPYNYRPRYSNYVIELGLVIIYVL